MQRINPSASKSTESLKAIRAKEKSFFCAYLQLCQGVSCPETSKRHHSPTHSSNYSVPIDTSRGKFQLTLAILISCYPHPASSPYITSHHNYLFGNASDPGHNTLDTYEPDACSPAKRVANHLIDTVSFSLRSFFSVTYLCFIQVSRWPKSAVVL